MSTMDLDRVGQFEGHALHDTHKHAPADLSKSEDSRVVLNPKTSQDADDPLNWSLTKKNTILAIISFVAFLPDFAASLSSVSLIPQSKEWHLPEATVQHNLVGNIFMLGAGGIFVVTLSAYFGRLPVLLYFHLIAFGIGIWCAKAKTFNSFLAARIVNGFFATVCQSGGLMFIKDMFLFHERPRKINIWSAGIIISPYFGPLVEAFLIWHSSWRWGFWLYTILNGTGLALIILLMDETLYHRGKPSKLPSGQKSRWLRLCGVEQLRDRRTGESFRHAMSRSFVAFSKVLVILLTIYYFLCFAWVIGVNATVAVWLTEIYKFEPNNLGAFYLAGIIGAFIGWLAGHWLHDSIGCAWARRRQGKIEPEARLIVCYLAMILMVVALVILAFSLQNHWHYMIVAVFYAVQVCGIMITTVGVDAYLLDSYPEGPAEVGTWVNVGRSFGGCMATYIQLDWVESAGGTKNALGAQAGIVAAATLLIAFIQVFGAKIRQLQGPMVV